MRQVTEGRETTGEAAERGASVGGRIPVLLPVGVLVTVAGLLAADVWMDRRDGASLTHLAVEIVALAAAGLTALTLVLLWQRERRRLRAARQAVASARARSRSLELEAARWRTEAEQSLRGLGEAIDRQFDRWGLTAAEREVGLLLLKGLAMKEIAGVRQTSERTARDQARAVYRKAGVSGRAELSAFFLEDLLLPVDPGGSPGEPG